MKINIVIPMAGLGSRFAKEGYSKPKPFIDVLGKPMIERVMENLSIPNATYILIARKEHIELQAETIKVLKKKFDIIVESIDKVTEGAVCTVLHTRKYINNETPLLLANCDQIVDTDIQSYIEDCFIKKADGSILTFIDAERNPKWSFAKVDDNNWVTEVKEKEAISEFATVGLYFFSKGKYCVDYALDMIVRNERVNNEFYTCPVYNYALADGKKITHYLMDFNKMYGIGTPDDLNKFLSLNPLNY